MQRRDLRNPAAIFRPRRVVAKLVLVVVIEPPLMTGLGQSLKNRSVTIPETMNRFPSDLVAKVRAIGPSRRGSAMNEKTIGPGGPGQRRIPVIADRKFGGQLVDHWQLFSGIKATHDVADVIRSGRTGIFGNRSGITTRET